MNPTRTFFRLIMGERLPIRTGRLAVEHIQRSVQIRRDAYGIAYIRARTERDAWYGVGFCQGQDRAFQLERLLRTVRGTLSEIVGPETIPIDRLSRRIGFYRSAKEQLRILAPGDRECLSAFAQGVTAGMRQGVSRKAHAFSLLQTSPTTFTAADALGILKLLSFLLPSNWAAELARLQILRRDGPEAVKALEPVYPEWLPTSLDSDAVSDRTLEQLTEDLNRFIEPHGLGGGSNNWVVAARHTANNRSILACDPHLPPNLPPHWYLSHIRTDDGAATGASLAGTPGYPVGFNGTLAWGITAGLTDNTDLFVEKLDENSRRVADEDGFVPCLRRTEVIDVKGSEPVEEEVLITPRGPIISPELPDEPYAVSLQATWLQSKRLKGFLDAHRTDSIEDFRQTFRHWPFLPLNLLYARGSSDIGWQLIGELPQRKAGWGILPGPGWKKDSGWENSNVPFERMPGRRNPPEGFMATANNAPGSDADEPFLGIDWIDGYRVCRILDCLAQDDDWTVEKMLTLQLDRDSVPWSEIKDIILALPSTSSRTALALQLLQEWNGRVAKDSAAASIFELFVAEMSRRIVLAKAPNSGDWALGKGFHPLVPHSVFGVRRVGHLVRLLREQPDDWLDRPWREEMADALETAVARLENERGADPADWAWGMVRPLTLEHDLGEQPPLDRIYNRGPFPHAGDSNTVAQASVLPTAPTDNPLFIPSLRMVVEIDNWENNRFVLPGGQSGNPLSPNYDDLLELWKQGKGTAIAWSPESVRTNTEHHLRLDPSDSNKKTG